MKMCDLAVIILTGNEELHIARCLERLMPLAPKEIFIIDCFSQDGTVAQIDEFKRTCSGRSRECRIEVLEHPWPGNQAEQFNWALDNAPITAKWVLRLDADEYLHQTTIEEIKHELETVPDAVSAYAMSFDLVWQGELIKHPGASVVLTRLFRFGVGRYEKRIMDEHIVVASGEIRQLRGRFVDENLNDMAWWTQKHLNYSLREAIECLRMEYSESEVGVEGGLNLSAKQKRHKKARYARLPLYWRALFYFVLRYFVKGGFMDGRAGWTRHFFQGLWYRMLVDARIDEIKRAAGVKKGDAAAWRRICDYVSARYGIMPA